jgi:prolyl 4-hydroxylase
MQRHPLLAQAFALSKAGRNAEAVLLVNQAVAQGDPESIYTLGEMKWRGGMVAQDLIQARELYRRASELRHGRAAANYTNLLANGVAGERNWPLALRRLEQEARSDPQRREALLLIRQMQLTPEGHPETISQPDVLSERPKVSFFPRLFSQTECAYLLKLAAPGYMPSTVYDAQRRLVRDPIRTSDASTIHWQIEDPAVHALNQRLAAVTGTTAEQGEALQILRYSQSQQYRKHFDFVQRSDNQRAQTALVYLNEDYEGGETLFVKTGLKVKGRTGDALVFVNSLADGSVDPMSEHAGLPVERGTKLLASRWIREKRWAP